MALLALDGRPIFRIGSSTVGIASDGETIFGLPASDSVDGTIAITEAVDTWAMTGTTTITGTIAITEAVDTWAMTGAAAVTGTIAITETLDSWSFTGAATGGSIWTARAPASTTWTAQ